jgi:hypothetical protein
MLSFQASGLTSGLGSSQVITTMLWVMGTGVAVWVLDNVLKRLENVMEDGFKMQARSLTQSLRINTAIILLCVSLFMYIKFYLKKDPSELIDTGIIGSVLWVFSTVGKFILHLFTYIIYWLHSGFNTSYPMTRPVGDVDVVFGAVIFLGYVIVKRLFIQRVSPLAWVAIVVLVTVAGTYVSNRTGVNPVEMMRKTIKNIQGDSTAIVNTEDDGIRLKPNPMDENDRTADNFTTSIPDSVIFPILEEFRLAVDAFIEEENRYEPRQEKYRDNLPAYQQAVANHMQAMQSRPSYKEIVRLTNNYKRDEREIFKDKRFQTILQELLCDFYSTYFDRICPDDPPPMAN